MVRWAELFWGGVLFAYSVFWFFNPETIFELEKKMTWKYWSIKDTEELEMTSIGAVTRQIVAGMVAVLGFALMLDAVVYQAL